MTKKTSSDRSETAALQLFRRYRGRYWRYRDLPPEARLAIGVYMAIDGEAWDAPEWWNQRIHSIESMLDFWTETYGEEVFGWVSLPVEDLKAATMETGEDLGERFQSFDEYHTWYVENCGGRAELARRPGTPWPVILDAEEEREVLQDGWHRFHRGVLEGRESFNAVLYPRGPVRVEMPIAKKSKRAR